MRRAVRKLQHRRIEDCIKLTEAQKKRTKKPINKNGTSSQPMLRRRNNTRSSIGIVTTKRVIMTTRVLGCVPSSVILCIGSDCNEDAAACNAVDNLDTKMEPVPPGKPVKM